MNAVSLLRNFFEGRRRIITTAALFLCINMSGFSQEAFDFVTTPGLASNSVKLTNNVNQFTGTVSVSFPLYTYKSATSNLAFSTSLNYNSGGLSLQQNPSSVGAGWQLSAGGSIRRIIKGLPDDYSNTTPSGLDASGFAYAPAIDNNPCPLHYRSQGRYQNTANKVLQDSEPDEFYFNFMGHQGSFVLPKGGLYSGGPQVITRPQSNLTFGFLVGNPSNIRTDIREIVVRDDNGMEYFFTVAETNYVQSTTSVYESTPQYLWDKKDIYHYEYTYTGKDDVVSWNLVKIRDDNNNEEIIFEYDDYGINTITTRTLTEFDKLSVSSPSSEKSYYWDDRNYEKGNRQRIRRITFPNNDVVTFEYSANPRCDDLSDKALQKIIISNSFSHLTSSYQLDHSYYQGSTEIPFTSCTSSNEPETKSKWLFLKSIARTLNSHELQIADFEYYMTSPELFNDPDNVLPTRKESKNQDKWGFYNGGEVTRKNASAVNFWTHDYFEYLGYTPPSGGYAKIGQLKKIVYPTGGSTSLEYEGHVLLDNGIEVMGSGVRLKKITEHDGISTVNDIVKQYEYVNTANVSSGFRMPLPQSSYINEMYNSSNVLEEFRVTIPSCIISPIAIHGSPVAYSRVTELTSLGKSISVFTLLLKILRLIPSTIILLHWRIGLMTGIMGC